MCCVTETCLGLVERGLLYPKSQRCQPLEITNLEIFSFGPTPPPPPTTTTKPSKSDPPGNFQFCFDSPLHPGVSRTSDVVRTREVQENGGKMTVPDWGRQIFFSLNYMEVQQTKGLKNWDCTKFILVYTTQAEQ